jgi:hypothetical protein
LIRTDILQDKKCIHVKLTKDVHLKLREKLFHYQLSMQAVFDEFARLVVEDEKSAIKILEDLAIRRAKEELEKPIKKPVSYNRASINELDHNTLYNMINDD